MKKLIQSKKLSFGIFLILLLFTFQVSLIHNTNIIKSSFESKSNQIKIKNTPKDSLAVGGSINITSFKLNHTKRYQNETITIRGNITDNSGNPISGAVVGVFFENQPLYADFNATTKSNGNYSIDFTIPFGLTNYYPSYEYEIQINVTDNSKGRILKNNSLFIKLIPWGNLTLTNPEIMDNPHYHNETIAIKGNLKNSTNDNVANYNVSLLVNGNLMPEFNATTDATGNFSIDYKIPFSLNISQSHLLQVNVTHGNRIFDVNLTNSFSISLVPYIRINLTNYMINNSYNFNNDSIPIKGKTYEYLDYSKGVSDQIVSLYIDGQLQSSYQATTDSNGEFQINYPIPSNFNLYQAYKIEVNVTQGAFIDESVLDNYFIFYVKANSTLEITNIDPFPKIPGEIFRVEGILRYDYHLGSGIPSAEINYFWYNNTFQWPVSSFFTRATDGSFSENLRIPINAYSSIINLNMSFPGDYTNIGYSDVNITNIKLFSNIIIDWTIVSKASEGDNITIAGQIASFPNNSLLIFNRSITIEYNGTHLGTVVTDENGYFTYRYTIPGGIGNMIIKVELVTSGTLTIDNIFIVNVTSVYNPPPGTVTLPFLDFSIIFFPILIGIVSVLGVFGYRYYKKKEKESRVVRVELDPKILNLKILKDSGRLEESLSYLFNAIFMTLIEAKYNRTRKENETIRDFAIISVKELKLTPTAIYPFIQKVEEIIYGRPFNITEKEFYQTCELFSPLYFELTGNNFVLTI